MKASELKALLETITEIINDRTAEENWADAVTDACEAAGLTLAQEQIVDGDTLATLESGATICWSAGDGEAVYWYEGNCIHSWSENRVDLLAALEGLYELAGETVEGAARLGTLRTLVEERLQAARAAIEKARGE